MFTKNPKNAPKPLKNDCITKNYQKMQKMQIKNGSTAKCSTQVTFL